MPGRLSQRKFLCGARVADARPFNTKNNKHMDTLFIAAAVTGLVLLWRTFRYDDENPLNAKLDAWPYVLRKPITCGLCITFWLALLSALLFEPFPQMMNMIALRIALPPGITDLIRFLASWLALGTLSSAMVYFIDTFYQVSHYYKHAAHSGD